MYVTAQMIAKEVGLSAKTIMAHVRKAEKIGWNVRRRIGKPAMINYENFMAYVNGEELDDFKKRKTICDWMSSGISDVRDKVSTLPCYCSTSAIYRLKSYV